MNVFQGTWKNLEARTSNGPLKEIVPWLNELNQAVFSRLEKQLAGDVELRVVDGPAFVYYTAAAGGYGVDCHSSFVESRRIVLDENQSFDVQVDSIVSQIVGLINDQHQKAKTTFFFTPVIPLYGRWADGRINRSQLVLRMRNVYEETVDVKEQK